MACSQTLVNITRGCEPSIGGIKELYYANKDDVGTITVTSDVVTAITMLNSATFYSITPPRHTSGLESTWQISEDNGTKYVESSLSLVFNKMETTKRAAMMVLAQGDFVVIVVDKNGKHWLLGYEEAVHITAGTAGTGTALADRNGYTITLTDNASQLPYEVDASIIAGLL